jgi:hypothetical protein
MVILAPIERETLQVFLRISQMLNVSTVGNTSDIYAIVHLVPHACQRITVYPSHSSGDTGAEILEISGEWRHKDSVLHKPPEDTLSICEICKKKTWRVSLSISVRITMIHYVVYLLRIFKTFHGLINNPVFTGYKGKSKIFPVRMGGVEV